MSAVRSTPFRSQFALRGPMRRGQLYALLDATGFAGLADDLAASGLEYCSLFSGDDAVLLRDEAPWLVELSADKISTWAELLRRAEVGHAGMLCVSNASLDDLRRHWKKWLSVHIPTQEGLVLFRFYDARIAVAFLATVGAADAQAFFGPNQALIARPSGTAVELRPSPPCAATRLGVGRWYRMTELQMQAFSSVAAGAFHARFRDYMRDIWAEETAGLDDAALDAKAERAIKTARQLGVEPQPNVIVDLAVIEMVAPSVIKDAEQYIAQFRGRVKPSGYSNILLAVATSSLSAERAEVVTSRAAYWTSYP